MVVVDILFIRKLRTVLVLEAILTDIDFMG